MTACVREARGPVPGEEFAVHLERGENERNRMDLSGRGEHLTFFVGAEECAVDLRRVKEIVGYDTVTRALVAPPSIRGFISVHGKAVPVVDVAVTLGLGATPATRRTNVVVVEVSLDGQQTAAMGVLADGVCQVIGFLPEKVDQGSAPARVPAEYTLGVGTVGGKVIPVLDIDKLMSSAVRGHSAGDLTITE